MNGEAVNDAPAEKPIQLDRLHQAVRRGMRWVLYRRDEGGIYRIIEDFEGGRRSIYFALSKHRITPSEEAEQLIKQFPERTAFPPDEPEGPDAA